MQRQAPADIADIQDAGDAVTAPAARPQAPRLHDTIVVGGGPAGVSCALRLHQMGREVLLLEAGDIGQRLVETPLADQAGGLRSHHGGIDLAHKLRGHLDEARVPYRVGADVSRIDRAGDGLFNVRVGDGTLLARTVVMASGSRPRSGGFVASNCVGIGPAAPAQHVDVRRQRVAVLGSGDDALDQALDALRKGARSVHLYSQCAPTGRPHPMRHLLGDWIHVGPFTADASRMTVNDQRYDVFSVQFGHEPCLPAGLEPLMQSEGQVRTDGVGAVPAMPGLYTIGDAAVPSPQGIAAACAQAVRAAKAIARTLSRGRTMALAAPMPRLSVTVPTRSPWLNWLLDAEEESLPAPLSVW